MTNCIWRLENRVVRHARWKLLSLTQNVVFQKHHEVNLCVKPVWKSLFKLGYYPLLWKSFANIWHIYIKYFYSVRLRIIKKRDINKNKTFNICYVWVVYNVVSDRRCPLLKTTSFWKRIWKHQHEEILFDIMMVASYLAFT